MRNVRALFVSVFGLVAMTSFAALAAEGGETAAAASSMGASGSLAIAAGFGMALAVMGGTWGQSKAIQAALEGIARNPAASGKILVPMILGLALIESLVLFGFIIMNKLSGFIG